MLRVLLFVWDQLQTRRPLLISLGYHFQPRLLTPLLEDGSSALRKVVLVLIEQGVLAGRHDDAISAI